MQISGKFDSGSISVVSAADPQDIRLALVPDAYSDLRQWFYFSVINPPAEQQVITILHVKDSAYPDGWPVYQALASHDRETWFRVPTTFDGDSLTIRYTPPVACTWYAYAVPYTYERHMDRIARVQNAPQCAVTTVGESLDGRAIHMLTFGRPGPGKRRCWFVGRQHSGETMAEWYLEGVSDRLLMAKEDVAHMLLEKAVIHVVPNLNPDGTVRGHQRLNAAGVDLNRQWLEPSLEKSPEIFHVRKVMQEIGADFCLDAHGDENIPYVFLAARPFSDRVEELRNRFKAAFLAATPEFQITHGYTADPSTPLNRTVAVNYVGTAFDCVSFTLEMPFSDNLMVPDPGAGWSKTRARKLGADSLTALLAIVDDLR